MQLINEFQKEVLAKVGKKKYTLCTGGRGIGSSYALALAARTFNREMGSNLVIYMSDSPKSYTKLLETVGPSQAGDITYVNTEYYPRYDRIGMDYDQILVIMDSLYSCHHLKFLEGYLGPRCATEVKYLVFNPLEDLIPSHNLWSEYSWLHGVRGFSLEDKLVKRDDVTLIIGRGVEDSPRTPPVLTI